MLYPRPRYLSFRLLFIMIALSVSAMTLPVWGQPAADTAAAIDIVPETESRPVEYRRPFHAPMGGIWTGERPALPLAGGLDGTFRPEIWAVPGSIRASALQPDGKLVLAGFFRTMNGERRSGLLRLHPGGAVDATLNVSVRGSVATVAVQPDGKIVLGGFFTAVNGVGRKNIARIYPDGSLDSSFDPGAGADNSVNDMVVQPDGKIVIVGSFTGVGNNSSPYIGRLNANGTVDDTFASPIMLWPPNVVPTLINAVALQPDGKIVAGGLIVINGMSVPALTRPIVRFNADGSFDGTFNPPTISSNLFDVAVQPDGKLIMGGFFTTVGGSTRRYLARLNPDGSLDAGFDTGNDTPSPVRAVHLKADGKILAGPLSAISAFGVVRQFNPNGSLDRTFTVAQALTGGVNTVNVTAEGKIFAGGAFSPPITGDEPNTALAFDAAGSVDANYHVNSTAIGGVRSIVVQPDGKVLIGGSFSRVNGARKAMVTRLNADGSIDTSFNPQGPAPNSSFSAVQVNVVLRQPDGKILVGGTNINNGSGVVSVVRLNADGSWDGSFTQGAIPVPPGPLASRISARALALQDDGKVLVAFSDPSQTPGAPAGMARLNSNGSIDQTFSAPALTFEKIAVLPDGRILAGGPLAIGYVNSTTGESDFYFGMVRLHNDGAHDRSFRAAFVSDLDTPGGRFTGVYALDLRPGGKILVGGQLYTQGNNSPIGVARLHPNGDLDNSYQRHPITNAFDYPRVEALTTLPDGKTIAAGLFDSVGFSSTSNMVALDGNGLVLDEHTIATDGIVHELAVLDGGRAYVGGDFDSVNGTAQASLARARFNIGAGVLFDYDGDGKADLSVRRPSDNVWHLLRAVAGYTAMEFGEAGDRMVPADYDGDGKTDVAVFRPSNGRWYVYMSESQTFAQFGWGQAGDLPVPTDRDADGKTDLVIFRPSNNTWYTRYANGTFNTFEFGETGDKPVVGDFDGDGVGDVALFRPSNNNWYIIKSSLGFFVQTWGQAGDLPLTADFDGDGKTDQAVYRPGTGQWFLSQTTEGFAVAGWGEATDIPVPADYDGDGRADIAVFRPSNGTWYIIQSGSGLLTQQFGVNGDVPTQTAYQY